jgi:hypothetical protein
MKKAYLPFLIFIFIYFLISCQAKVLSDTELVSWNDHFMERSSIGASGTGRLIIASETSDVRVARLIYSPENLPEKIADIYYPSSMDLQKPRGAVILIAGDSDNHAKEWFGRVLKDTDQYMDWGQVIAEEGMIAISYELGNPEAALENLMAWVVENNKYLGVDTAKIGFFSINENGCSTGLETIVDGSTKYSGPKPVFSIFYYGMMPLRSKEIYSDVPVMTVTTQDLWDRGIPESMDEFNIRAIDSGALLTAVSYPEGVHWFDLEQDTPRSRDILQETLAFMKAHL